MRKKLFAVIMSAMMMITFMPAMAFAYTPTAGTIAEFTKVVYSGDYSTATAYYTDVAGKTQKIVGFVEDAEKLHFDKATGKMVVTFTFETAEVALGKVTKTFYNLNDVAVVSSSNVVATELVYPTGFTGTIVPKSGNIPAHYQSTTPIGNYLRFVNPSKKTETKAVDPSGIENLDFMVGQSNYEPYNEGTYDFPLYLAKEDYDLSVDNSGSNFTEGTGNAVNEFTDNVVGITGTAPTKQSVSVKIDGTIDVDSVPVKINGVEDDLMNSGVIGTYYTGENVKVELLAKGLDVQYQLVDYTGNASNWSATFPEIKDAGNYVINVKVTKTYGDKSSVEFQKRVNVAPASVYFDYAGNYDNSITYSNIIVKHEGQEITNSDLVTLRGWSSEVGFKFTAEDLKTWKTIAEKYAVVDGIETMVGDHVLTSYLKKDVFADEDAAIVKFLANFELEYYDSSSTITTWHGEFDMYPYEGGILRIAEGKNDVTAVSQSKTIKYKSLKKKAQKFNLKGDVADWGTLTYIKTSGNSKISVAKSGKVTVKKGLKKGTYKVKIKVKAPGDSAMKTLKVKVK